MRPTTLPARATAAGPRDEVEQEQRVVLRMWGRLQNELSTQMLHHAREQARLQAEVMRLRAALLLTRTAVWWGMGLGGSLVLPARTSTPRPTPRPTPIEASSPADEVLCQTACVGHAHHWLDTDQACARTGLPCHRVNIASAVPAAD